MAKLFVHPFTQARLAALQKDLPHAILIHGARGAGLTELAKQLAASVSMQPQIILPERNEVVDIEKGTITVDIIRRLYDMTKTKQPSGRFMVIDYAETMGVQAQNAFLKLLEEPSPDTHFVLLCHDSSRLLPTIMSRVQTLEVRPVTDEQSQELLDQLGVSDSTRRTQLLFIAKGLPAELTRLANHAEAFSARAAVIQDARAFLQGDTCERLKLALKYKDSRADALMLLEDAMKLLERSVREGKTPALKGINGLLEAHERITANGNIRLQLSAVMV